MHRAPLASTIIAIALLPIALLLVHAFVSGRKKGGLHKITGLLAILGDLTISIGYMIYRSMGGKVGGSSLQLSGGLLIYFIIHGIISLVVIILEISILISAIVYLRNKTVSKSHAVLGKILFYIWWLAFLSGEFYYAMNYIFRS